MISTPDFENRAKEMFDWLRTVPYEVSRQERLYSAEELYRGYKPSNDEVSDRESFAECYDSRVYKHFMNQGKIAMDVNESLARTLHDHGIHTALKSFLKEHDPLRCIGIMGGHALLRNDPMFASVAMLSKRLTEQGFFMVSGGGPGAMEATHLGAWMAGRTDDEARDAIRMLTSAATSYKDWRWLSSAFEVMRRYPQKRYVSLGIPTWLYGHEPSTPFATHIAKYFTNSVREDTILTVAFGGIIYTPGSAGTLQEVFQNAVQDHYLSFGFSSPMIFLGKRFWTEDIPIYSLMRHMEITGRYKNLLLTLTDDPAEIERVLEDFQMKRLQK
jgi:predicted Rossmann-fold nucleotide-binding protein